MSDAGLTADELQTVIEALEAYLDAVYRSNSDVEYKHAKGAEIWRLRERLRRALVVGRDDDDDDVW